jgi:hypothetical protein
MAQGLAEQLSPVIARLESELHRLLAPAPTGEALAPRLATAFGSERDRYDSAEDARNSLAWLRLASGKTKWVQWPMACPKFFAPNLPRIRPHVLQEVAPGHGLATSIRAEAGITTLPFVRWPTNGPESSTAAGRIARLTMSRFI